jgi:hypothetical protein
MSLDLWGLSDEALLDLVRPDIDAARRADASFRHPVDPEAWRLVHAERGPELTLLVAVSIGASGVARVVLVDREGAPAVHAVDVSDAPYMPFGSLPFWTEGIHDWRGEVRVGLTALVFAAEPGVTAVRVRRIRPHTSELPLVLSGGFAVLVDREPGPPVSGFTDVLKDGAWLETFAGDAPCSCAHAAAMYDLANGHPRRKRAPPGELGTDRDRYAWLEAAPHEIPWDTFRPLIVRLLKGFRYPEHAGGIGSLSAAVYGQDHWFYDAVEAELDRIDPAVLYYYLMFEKEEFLPADVRRRYAALCGRLARRLGATRTRELHDDVRSPR